MPYLKPFEWWFRGDAGLMVFKVSSDKRHIEHLSGDGMQAIVTVPNPAALQNEGANLLVLMLNNRHKPPYSSKSNYMLYSVTGKPSGYTHNCAHATATFSWSGFKKLFPYHLSDDNNLNMRADYPEIGGAVSAGVTVSPQNCEPGKTYSWCFRFFDDPEGACKPATCGTEESMSLDGVFQGNTSMNDLEYLSFSYTVQDNTGAEITVTSDCQLHITPFLLDVPAS